MIFDGWDIFGRSRTLTLRKTWALLPSHASSRLEECCWFRKSLWFQQGIILNKGLSSLSRSQQPGEQEFLLNSCTARRTEPMPGFAYFNKLQRGYFFLLIIVWKLLLKPGSVVPSRSLADSDSLSGTLATTCLGH